ncbi:MAG: flagellar hook-basal body complex protein FliE [Candidatus Acidiferrales bacterium]
MANAIPGFTSMPPVNGPGSAAAGNPASGMTGPGDGPDFTQTLDGMMNQVADMQTSAQAQVVDLLQGNGQDVHSAMIAVEKADLSFQLMMQVRNKIIQAYQTISQMPF